MRAHRSRPNARASYSFHNQIPRDDDRDDSNEIVRKAVDTTSSTGTMTVSRAGTGSVGRGLYTVDSMDDDEKDHRAVFAHEALGSRPWMSFSSSFSCYSHHHHHPHHRPLPPADPPGGLPLAIDEEYPGAPSQEGQWLFVVAFPVTVHCPLPAMVPSSSSAALTTTATTPSPLLWVKVASANRESMVRQCQDIRREWCKLDPSYPSRNIVSTTRTRSILRGETSMDRLHRSLSSSSSASSSTVGESWTSALVSAVWMDEKQDAVASARSLRSVLEQSSGRIGAGKTLHQYVTRHNSALASTTSQRQSKSKIGPIRRLGATTWILADAAAVAGLRDMYLNL